MKEFDCIVVGGGIVGATSAAMMSAAGLDVALLDAGICGGQGGTAYSGGIVRLYDSDQVMQALGKHAFHVRRTNPVGLVFDASIRQTGVLYRAEASDESEIRRTFGHEMSGGTKPRFLSGRELTSLTDFVEPSEDKVDLFEPEGGHSDVRYAVQAMARLTREQGLVIEHAGVDRIETLNTTSSEVVLTTGVRLRARCLIIAAGAWSKTLMGDLGVEARTVPLGVVSAPSTLQMPIIDMPVGTYAVPFGRGVLGIGCGPRKSTENPNNLPAPSHEHVSDCLSRLQGMTGKNLGSVPITVLNGLDSYTADGRPIIGFLGPSSPIYAITGMSGLGFKIAPAVAEIATTEIRARLSDLDAVPHPLAKNFNPRRFLPKPKTAQMNRDTS